MPEDVHLNWAGMSPVSQTRGCVMPPINNTGRNYRGFSHVNWNIIGCGQSWADGSNSSNWWLISCFMVLNQRPLQLNIRAKQSSEWTLTGTAKSSTVLHEQAEVLQNSKLIRNMQLRCLKLICGQVVFFCFFFSITDQHRQNYLSK